MKIPFSPPDITNSEIDRVVEVLRSGWITTGKVTKQLELDISDYCSVKRTACLSSATAAMELSLRILGIGEGDEVITSAYTYSASASVIAHTGARIVLADCIKDGVAIDIDSVRDKITERTKAIIPVDIGGVPIDYLRLHEVVEEKRFLFRPANDIQKSLDRIAIIDDAAHAFGATYMGKSIAHWSDFCCFSFHAVKNLTTAEGGAVTFSDIGSVTADEIYKQFMLLSLHGQDKDALTKVEGGWEYDIKLLGYKYNMPDILAAFGAAQLERYDEMLEVRRELVDIYDNAFKGTVVKPLIHRSQQYNGSHHAYIVSIDGLDAKKRNHLIVKMEKRGVSLNVHFKPLPLHTAYINLGFDIGDYPNALAYYNSTVSLPLYSAMTKEIVMYVVEQLLDELKSSDCKESDHAGC